MLFRLRVIHSMELLSQAAQWKVSVMVACAKAPVSPQTHMASNDNAQISQSLLGFSGCFRHGRQERQMMAAERESGRGIKWGGNDFMTVNVKESQVGWVEIEAKGCCLWCLARCQSCTEMITEVEFQLEDSQVKHWWGVSSDGSGCSVPFSRTDHCAWVQAPLSPPNAHNYICVFSLFSKKLKSEASES